MASKYSKTTAEKYSKMTSEQKIKRALSALDSAVQEWYAEHNSENKNRYASAHICNYEEGLHASRITLQIDVAGEHYRDIYSSKCSKELR